MLIFLTVINESVCSTVEDYYSVPEVHSIPFAILICIFLTDAEKIKLSLKLAVLPKGLLKLFRGKIMINASKCTYLFEEECFLVIYRHLGKTIFLVAVIEN